MGRPLDARELSSLDELGFVLVARALEPSHVARLLLAFAQAPSQADGTQHVRLADATPELGAWQALERHAVILSATARVLGGAAYQTNLHGRNPLPSFGEQGLHSDARPRARGEPNSVLTAIWMLDDFTDENGATRVVPRSHRLLGAVPKSWAQPGARHPDEIVVTGQSGSVLVMNGYLWHAGRRNQSRGPRRAAQHVLRVGGVARSSNDAANLDTGGTR
jgi:ectoine hydroxylase-related dioxygenase (phytanoyl-CoA dioxygenase family)